MVSQFEELGLLPQFVQSVAQLGFEQPTPIQQAAIPALLAGRNVVGQAQTGTGKTAAFALPMLQYILLQQNILAEVQNGKGAIQALVLAPTRELAIQVAEATSRMARPTSVRVMAVYGGQSYQIQIRQLKRGVEVVVGTPGRLLDLIRQGLLDLSQVRYLVLDEADEMLEMGFIEDVEAILEQIQGERQIALFSATLPPPIRKLADRYLSDPHEITINPSRLTVAETEQRFCRVREENKIEALTRLMEVEDVKSALIFARTKARTQDLADELVRRGYPAEALHGDLTQPRREFVLNRFRQHTITLLVATDVAARGLDIENVSHVFNYDAPNDAEDYVHRIGRTGRAGRKGIAITFFGPREYSRLKQIEFYTKQKISEIQVPNREAIQAHRDERFLERLTEQLIQDPTVQQRNMINRLVQYGYDLEDIAAAAMQLARSEETALPAKEIYSPAAESKYVRSSERNFRPAKAQRGVAKVLHEAPVEWEEKRPNKAYHKKGQREPGMVRLWMNVGDAQGLRPSDVVGAIASEVGIPGRAIGEIDIRKDHTFVDVAEKHVRQVLQESGGQYRMRGKPVTLKLAN